MTCLTLNGLKRLIRAGFFLMALGLVCSLMQTTAWGTVPISLSPDAGIPSLTASHTAEPAPPATVQQPGPAEIAWRESPLQTFILGHDPDYNKVGWFLFVITWVIYIISKNEWLKLKYKLEAQALSDELTRLPNRRLFMDRLEQSIRLCRRNNKKFALIMADLDQFKEVNDTLGHHAGDELLIQITSRFRDIMRDSDTIARLGGDEFAFIFHDVNNEQDIHIITNRMIEQVENPIIIDGMPFSVGVSIGVSIFPEHGDTAESLMRRADIALYQAKEQKNCAVFYNKADDHKSREIILMQHELRNAIKQETLEVFYQPKVDCNTKSIIGVEALARWPHPTQGMIPPSVFIPLAKQTGLINKLTMLVLRKSIQQASQWYHQGLNLSLAVNITGNNIEDINFADELMFLLKRFDFPPHLLELEITEDVIISNIKRAVQVTQKLNEMGIAISIDDFGTGNSSISYLKKLPIQTLKIDYSFIRDMKNDESDEAIVKTTIMLGKTLGLTVVAEGVEDVETLDRLSKMGCDLAQGFYMCKPVPGEDLAAWIQQSEWGQKSSRKRLLS